MTTAKMTSRKKYTASVFIVAFTLFNLVISAQTQPWWCPVSHTIDPASQSTASQPTNCTQFLQDLAPLSVHDGVAEVNVNVVIFAPTTNSASSAWTHSLDPVTQADIEQVIAGANYTFANMPSVPQLTIPGGPTGFTDAKIKLVLKSWQIVYHDSAYGNVSNAAHGDYGTQWVDPNAINVFLGTMGSQYMVAVPSGYTQIPVSYPYNTIYFTTWHHRMMTPHIRDNIRHYGGVLAHEVGHVLGLEHSTGTYTQSSGVPERTKITPAFGCCTYIEPSDFLLETYPCGGPCIPMTGCDTPGTSDNLMCEAGGCNRYLSPQQAAVMHYNLRTRYRQFLTLTGYHNITTANAAFNYSVTSNEVWQDGDRYIKGDITVKAGNSLTIKCGVAMTHGAKIIVEKTALLVVDGGTITNISNRTWDGIYVIGDPSQSQAVSSGMPLHQGMAKLINGAAIKHAVIGVRNHLNYNHNYGGIIYAEDSYFMNNQIDVQFLGSDVFSSNTVSNSRFVNCQFKTNAHIGDGLEPVYHANMVKSVGVWFFGCVFEHESSSPYVVNIGYGIYSVNSMFTVTKSQTNSEFIGLRRGIFVNNYDPMRVPVISNSYFINNYGYGAYFMNVNYLVFQRNTIQNPLASIYSGVYLNNCKYYTIKNNVFLEDPSFTAQATAGIEIFNSGAGVHQVYYNTFSNFNVAINAMGNNSGATNFMDGLKLNCNDFTQSANKYDIALNPGTSNTAPSVMWEQGQTSILTSSNVVRNMYGATCTGNQNQWYVHWFSNKAIIHGSNQEAFTQPLPQPACSNTLVNVVNMFMPLNYTAVCGPYQSSSGGSNTLSVNRLNAMNEYIEALQEDQVNNDANHHFEIQATVASKLHLFLTDSLLQNMDSVIHILENNPGNMDDADIQTIFAHMSTGNYSQAQNKITGLPAVKADWRNLLAKLIDVKQDTSDACAAVQSHGDFFYNHAATDSKDGQSIAQAVIKAFCDSNYTEPHNYPEEMGERAQEQESETGLSTSHGEQTIIQVYPNPAQNGVTVHYNTKQGESVNIELRDLLGRLIYTNFINGPVGTEYISLNGLSNGMYLLSLNRDKEVIYTTKLIKED